MSTDTAKRAQNAELVAAIALVQQWIDAGAIIVIAGALHERQWIRIPVELLLDDDVSASDTVVVSKKTIYRATYNLGETIRWFVSLDDIRWQAVTLEPIAERYTNIVMCLDPSKTHNPPALTKTYVIGDCGATELPPLMVERAELIRDGKPVKP